MKVALLAYHKNINTLYPKEWIEEYKQSILNQTAKDVSIFEQNYGNDNYRIFDNSYFESVPMPTFVHALNYLIKKVLSGGYDGIFNTNCDDYFSLDRIEKQLFFIEQGYDIVSSNFSLVQDGVIIKTHSFEKLDLALELSNNHNPICHPVVGYSRNFLLNNSYVPEQQPLEDMMLWQRTVKKYKFIILPDVLCYHRIHDNAVCRSENR